MTQLGYLTKFQALFGPRAFDALRVGASITGGHPGALTAETNDTAVETSDRGRAIDLAVTPAEDSADASMQYFVAAKSPRGTINLSSQTYSISLVGFEKFIEYDIGVSSWVYVDQNRADGFAEVIKTLNSYTWIQN